MFAKKDYIDYLEQVKAVERKMKREYRELAGLVETPAYREILAQLSRDERAHEENLNRVFPLLEKMDR